MHVEWELRQSHSEIFLFSCYVMFTPVAGCVQFGLFAISTKVPSGVVVFRFATYRLSTSSHRLYAQAYLRLTVAPCEESELGCVI